VDDFLIFSHSKAELWRWKSALEARLATLRLTIHLHPQPKPVTEGIPFLGFIVFPHRRRLKRRKGIHFARHLRGLARACETGLASLEEVNAAVRGWLNHVRCANTVGLRKAVLGSLRLRPAKPSPSPTVHVDHSAALHQPG
jgi:RNA-directed DNA polymerase